MDNSRIVHFKKSEEIFDIAQKLFNEQQALLKGLFGFDVDVQHVGSSSMLGALSQADLDIQIRVDPENFNAAVEMMQTYATAKHMEIWTDQFAAFMKKENELPTDYVVTIFDSKYDDFYKVRDYLKTHPDVLAEYNALKQEYEGREYSEYSKAKVAFLGGNGKVKFLNYV